MNDQPDKQGFDSWFLAAAAAMMVVIIALLAGLWLSMRARAIQAESELARLRPLVGKQQADSALIGRLLQTRRVVVPPVDRSQLAAEAVSLNGREVIALKLPPGLAGDIGFAPGDLVIVGRPVPTQASSAPAGGQEGR